MRVAILGCGPAGLIAAHAAEQMGADVAIFSKKVRSEMFGAMYLHEPIPGIHPGEAMEIQVVKFGTREGYASNVYGDPNAPVSWDKFDSGPTRGWSLGVTYHSLYDLFSPLILDTDLTRGRVKRIVDDHDITFSSIPATVLCQNVRHRFKALPIWVLHGRAERMSHVNVMYYNGHPPKQNVWYRYSIINGYQSYEYSPYFVPPYVQRWKGQQEGGLQVVKGTKPLVTTCDCHPEIVRVGRFGRWNKNVFTHHAYREVSDALLKLR